MYNVFQLILTEFKLSIKLILYFALSIYYISLYNILSIFGLLNKLYYKRRFLVQSTPILKRHINCYDNLILKFHFKLNNIKYVKNGFRPVKKINTLDFFYDNTFKDYF